MDTACKSLPRLLLILVWLLPLQACTSVPAQFERALRSEAGVEGEIHGAHPDLGLYVFTYRHPKNFFDFIEVSLIASSADIAASMAELRRHDRVRIKGELLENRSPQRHVELHGLEVVRKYSAEPDVPAYDYQADPLRELAAVDNALFLVHAVHADGRILVVEYKDAVIPIHVRRPELARDLARNDVVRLRYEVRAEPQRPLHLNLQEHHERPVEVVDSVMAMHGKPADVSGALVLFPKSPQVRFNVFAVLQELPGGLKRQYTLANFESEEKFTQIREKLQAAWDASPAAISGRNKLISTQVRVRAKGRFNEVDANQANVQIVLDDADAIEILPVTELTAADGGA